MSPKPIFPPELDWIRNYVRDVQDPERRVIAVPVKIYVNHIETLLADRDYLSEQLAKCRRQ